jgi:hypothetical protein
MTSDKGGARNELDERIIAVRNSLLAEGENVEAEEEGDQGQGILLTDSRLIIIKVGFAATGSPEGKIVGSFPLNEIVEVVVRKGPLGAVIQVCAQQKQNNPGTPPDNVIIFTGPQRIKKCESIAAKIETALGKPVRRIEASSEKQRTDADSLNQDLNQDAAVVQSVEESNFESPAACADNKLDELDEVAKTTRGGRQPVTLAEQIFAEMTEQESAHESSSVSSSTESDFKKDDVGTVDAETQTMSILSSTESVAEEPPANERTASSGYRPNPNLPKPVKKRTAGLGKTAVVMAGLTAALLVGIAVTAPLRAPTPKQDVAIRPSDLSQNLGVLQKQQAEIAKYQAEVASILQTANRSLDDLETAIKSRNVAAIAKAASVSSIEIGWQKLTDLPAPIGLASAKESLTAGLFIGKTVATSVASDVRSANGISVDRNLGRIAEARRLLKKGFESITRIQSDLEREIDKCRRSDGSKRNNVSKP